MPVCPEFEIGLGVPRESLRLVGDPESPRLIAPKSGQDHTERMQTWARERLEELAAVKLHGFIKLGLFFLIQSVDARAVILGMLGFLVYLLSQQADAFTLAIWGGNMLILLWKHRRDLRQPIRPRPWVLNLARRGR